MERGRVQRLGIIGICDSNMLPTFPVIMQTNDKEYLLASFCHVWKRPDLLQQNGWWVVQLYMYTYAPPSSRHWLDV
jgi:hypothetical protein